MVFAASGPVATSARARPAPSTPSRASARRGALAPLRGPRVGMRGINLTQKKKSERRKRCTGFPSWVLSDSNTSHSIYNTIRASPRPVSQSNHFCKDIHASPGHRACKKPTDSETWQVRRRSLDAGTMASYNTVPDADVESTLLTKTQAARPWKRLAAGAAAASFVLGMLVATATTTTSSPGLHGASSLSAGAYKQIQVKGSSMCLGVRDHTNAGKGSKVQLFTCTTPHWGQEWNTDNGKLKYKLKNGHHLCATLSGGGANIGNEITLDSCKRNYDTQQFNLHQKKFEIGFGPCMALPPSASYASPDVSLVGTNCDDFETAIWKISGKAPTPTPPAPAPTPKPAHTCKSMSEYWCQYTNSCLKIATDACVPQRPTPRPTPKPVTPPSGGGGVQLKKDGMCVAVLGNAGADLKEGSHLVMAPCQEPTRGAVNLARTYNQEWMVEGYSIQLPGTNLCIGNVDAINLGLIVCHPLEHDKTFRFDHKNIVSEDKSVCMNTLADVGGDEKVVGGLANTGCASWKLQKVTN